MVSIKQVEGEHSFLSRNPSPNQYKGVKAYHYILGTVQHGNYAPESFACADQDSQSLLDSILLSQWEDRSCKGQLGYDVTTREIKVTDGERKFVVQLNDKRNSLFLEEFENEFFQSFGCVKPNYMRSCRDEMLLCITQGEKDKPELVSSTVPLKDGILLIASVNPVEYGHIFLVPSATNQLSHFWDRQTFGLVAKITREVNNTSFHVFFDYGTSTAPDYMYFQASYIASHLPVELVSTVPVYSGMAKSTILVSEIVDYPLKSLVFVDKNLNTLVDAVSEICSTLHERNDAFSLLITDCGTKMFLFPQARNLMTGRDLSSWECAGYFVYHTKSDFDGASEAEISNRMASSSLKDDSFQDLKHLCCSVAANLIT